MDNLENAVLSERSQAQNPPYYRSLLILNTQNRQIYRNRVNYLVPGDRERRKLKRNCVSFGGDGDTLELDNSDGFTTLQIY